MPFKKRLLSTLLFFGGLFLLPTIVLFSQPVTYSSEALEYLKLSEEQLEQEDFRKAIATLNQAMGILKETSRNHPLRIQVEKQLRIAKGRSIVAKYSRSHLSPSPSPTGLRPLEEEPKDFSVSQIFGRIISKNIWQERSELTTKDPVGLGRRLTVLPKGGIELYSNREELMFRSLDASSFDINGPSSMSLHSGSYIFHCSKANGTIKLKSPLSECEFQSDDPFVFMVGVTTNGGLKIIALLGKISCVMGREMETLIPGQLCFALTEGFSRTMNVELSTLIVTSKLITSFPRPPSFMKKLNQQAMLQALRTKQRYRTVVGDVKGNSDFEIKVIDDGRP
jgi:hypothetical protein